MIIDNEKDPTRRLSAFSINPITQQPSKPEKKLIKEKNTVKK